MEKMEVNVLVKFGQHSRVLKLANSSQEFQLHGSASVKCTIEDLMEQILALYHPLIRRAANQILTLQKQDITWPGTEFIDIQDSVVCLQNRDILRVLIDCSDIPVRFRSCYCYSNSSVIL